MTSLFSSRTKTPTMISFIALAVFFLGFLIYKLTHIDVPFFWDESWVYGPAVSAMGERFPSLLSGSIDIDLSRGHPMLFHFLGGLWGNIFGISVSSLHMFALTISLLLIISVFYISSRLYSPRIAAVSTTLLLVQGVFLAQASMVLPEVLVALFALWSIYHFSQHKYLLASIFAALCLLTKESGAILMPALGLAYLLHSFLCKEFEWKIAIRILLFLIVACIPYIAFLWFQHRTFGWYLFPNHVDLQIKDVQNWQRQLVAATRYVFEAQGRLAISITAIGIVLYKLQNNFPIILWLVNMFFIATFILAFPMESFVLFGMSICLFIGVFIMGIVYFKLYKESYFFILISSIFLFLFLLFTGYNFFSARYVLVLIPLFLLAFAQSLKLVVPKFWVSIGTIALALICLWQAFRADGPSDTNQAFIPASYLQKEFFEHIENKNIYDHPIFAPFLSIEALQKFHSGYRSTEVVFSNVNNTNPPDKKMYIIRSSYQGSYTPAGITDGRILLDKVLFEKKNHWFVLEEYSEVKNTSID